MTGLSVYDTIYKSCRPQQICKSELKVANVAKIIELDYIDPFGLDAEKESLVNIASGMSLADDITPEVLKQVEKEKS